MNCYLAKIVFRIICGDGVHTPQFDEQLRLVAAANAALAFAKALTLGKAAEDVFYNAKQKTVQWKFINVAEIILLNELVDGGEIYSSIKEMDDAAVYENLVHKKAEMLSKEIAEEIL